MSLHGCFQLSQCETSNGKASVITIFLDISFCTEFPYWQISVYFYSIFLLRLRLKRQDPQITAGGHDDVISCGRGLIPLLDAMMKWRQSLDSPSMTLPTFKGKKRLI